MWERQQTAAPMATGAAGGVNEAASVVGTRRTTISTMREQGGWGCDGQPSAEDGQVDVMDRELQP